MLLGLYFIYYNILPKSEIDSFNILFLFSHDAFSNKIFYKIYNNFIKISKNKLWMIMEMPKYQLGLL